MDGVCTVPGALLDAKNLRADQDSSDAGPPKGTVASAEGSALSADGLVAGCCEGAGAVVGAGGNDSEASEADELELRRLLEEAQSLIDAEATARAAATAPDALELPATRLATFALPMGPVAPEPQATLAAATEELAAPTVVVEAELGGASAAPQMLPRPEQHDAAGGGPADAKAVAAAGTACHTCEVVGDTGAIADPSMKGEEPNAGKQEPAVGEALVPLAQLGAHTAAAPPPELGGSQELQSGALKECLAAVVGNEVSQLSETPADDVKMDATSVHSDAESEPDDARLEELLTGALAAQASRAAEADVALQDPAAADDGSAVPAESSTCPAAPPRQLPCSAPPTVFVAPALEGTAEPQKPGAFATVEGRAPASPVVALQTKGRKRLADEMMFPEFPEAPLESTLEPTALLEILQDVLPPR